MAVCRLKPKSTDYNLFNGFRCCGILNIEHTKQLGTTTTRMLKLIDTGYVEKIKVFDPYSQKDIPVFRLTDKGRSFCDSQFDFKNYYKASSPLHDLRLGDRYSQLTDDLRRGWLTEGDIRDRFQEEFGRSYDRELFSMPDSAVPTEDGSYECFEVITDRYGKEEIEAKISVSVKLGWSISLHKH